jgi:hypothetical protein
MEGGNKSYMKMLQQVIKFVIDTRDRKLIFLKPKLDETRWEVKGYIALDFASDANRRKTISRYVIYLQRCPISWRSKRVKRV